MSSAPVTQDITQQAQQLPDNTAPPQAPAAAAQPPAAAPAGTADMENQAQATNQLQASGNNGQPAPEDNPTTHGWRAVVKGALQALDQHAVGAAKGFATGGLIGAAEGAVSPGFAAKNFQARQDLQQAKVQQAQSNIKFANAEAANQVAEANYRDAQRAQMPKELQLQQDTLDANTAKSWITAGLYPSIVVPNTSDGAHAAAQQLMDKNGSVPSLVFLHMGDSLVGFDPNSLAGNSAVLSQINNYQKVTGGQPMNLGQLKMAPNKTQLAQSAAQIFNPVFPGMDKAQGAISQYDGYIRNVSMWPDSDPEKAETLEKLKNAQQGLKTAYAARNADQLKAAEARGAASQMAKTDTYDVNGELKTMTAAQALQTPGAAKAAPAAQARSKNAQFNDIYSGVEQTKQAIDGLESEAKSGGKPVTLDAPTVAALTTALRVTDPNILQQVKDSLGVRSLSPAQRNLVDNILQLNERILSTRTIAGMGNQGSDSMRAAVAATLPSAKSGDTGHMKQQLNRVTNYLDNLHTGLQRTGDMPANTAAPAATQSNITHVSSDGAWAWNGAQWIPNPNKPKQ